MIGPQVVLGKGVKLHEHVVIKGCTQIGEDCEIFPFVSLGEPSQDKKNIQDGNRLLIGSRNIIREHTSIHTSSLPMGKTQIGSDCLIMGQVHIAHDCQIGNQVIVAQASALAGHVCIEDFATIGGCVAVHQCVHIGQHGFVGAQSYISQDVLSYCSAAGNRASLVGLNSVGLKRHGFSFEDRLLLKRAFKILFTSGLLLEEALSRLQDLNHSLVNEIILFSRNSKRGLLRFKKLS